MTVESHFPGVQVEEHDAALGASPLATYIYNLTLSGYPFTDVVLHEDRPLKIKAPDGLIVAHNLVDPSTGYVVCEQSYTPTRADFVDLLGLVDPEWGGNITRRAIDTGRSFGGTDRLRMNFFLEGEGRLAAVIRRFPEVVPTLEDLQVPDSLINLIQPRGGLILVIGQTGVGKSTTCAAMLKRIASEWATHIVTIEKPIEYVHRDDAKATFSQREVGAAGLSSAAVGIEDALRQAPGVIYVSEIRDRDTASAAFAAMDSGHLVIANTHARTPVEGIARLLRIASGDTEGRDSRCHALAANLIGAVSQTLVPIINRDRKRVGFRAFFEVLTNSDPVRERIAADRLDELQAEIEKFSEGSPSAMKDYHCMNSDLAQAISDAKVLQSDAISRTINVQDLNRRIRITR